MFTHRPLVTIALTFTAILLIIACSNTTETTEDTTSIPAQTVEPQISSVQGSPTSAPTLQHSPTSIPTQEVVNPSDVDILEDRSTEIFEATEISGTFEVAGQTKSVVIQSGTDGSVMKEGAVIKTGATEEVTTDITVDGTTRMMRTSPDTEWSVGDAEETGAVVIELTRGEIKIVDDGFGYFPMQVDTPTGSVLLRGTWVLVRVLSDGSTEVECVRGPCQYLDENSMSVVVADGGTVRDTTDADPSTGEMTEEEVTEFESIPEIQMSDLQNTYNERDPEEYEELLNLLASTWSIGNQWSPAYATYSGTVTIDGEDAPEGTEVRFRIPTASEMDNPTSNYGNFRDPSWSPNGTEIAFWSYRDGNPEIYVMDADGSNQTNITNHAGRDFAPTWSPDGTEIAFWSYRDGNPEIYVMDADGSNQTNITNHAGRDFAPSWSPDGTEIAFKSYRGGNQDIYVMDADGSNQTNITNNADVDSRPSWSPDGTQIAFSSNHDGTQDIYVMDADGSNQTNITNDAGVDTEPSWSPDGTEIAFWSYDDGTQDIYVMDADGSNQTSITNDAGVDSRPSWSPDGTQIAFASWRNNSSGIYVMDADGSNRTSITTPPMYIMDDIAESMTFATATVGSRGRFSTNVFLSVSDSPLKLSDGDLLAVDVVTPDGISESHLIEWSKGVTENRILLNVLTERPILKPTPTPTPTPTPQPTPTNTPVPTPTLGPVALPAIASNVIPHVFVGSVTVNGQVASDGAEVSAWVSEFRSPVGKGTVSDGSYVMNVSQYGIASFAGKTLTFKIDGVDTMQTATWATGGATVLDLAGD